MTVDRVFHALGDPTRRAMLERLSRGPAAVSSMAEPLGISVAAVVQHLQVLEQAGLVVSEKIGRVRTCRIDSKGFTVASEWIAARRTVWQERIDRLGDLLRDDTPDPETKP